MKEKNTGHVNFKLNLDDLPKLTSKQKTRLDTLKDEDIDYSDIPPSPGIQWTKPGALITSENKKQVTLRLDTDVLNFFRITGKRYQSRINAVLREYMESHL